MDASVLASSVELRVSLILAGSVAGEVALAHRRGFAGGRARGSPLRTMAL